MDPISSLAYLPRAMLVLSRFLCGRYAPLTQAFVPYALDPPPYVRRRNDWRRAASPRILKRCCKTRTLLRIIIGTVFRLSNIGP